MNEELYTEWFTLNSDFIKQEFINKLSLEQLREFARENNEELLEMFESEFMKHTEELFDNDMDTKGGL